MELYYATAYQIYVILEIFVTSCCFALLLRPFLAGRRLAWAVVFVYFTVIVFFYYMPWYIFNFAAYALGVLAVFLTISLADRRNRNQKLFLCILFFSLRWLSKAMVSCIIKIYFFETAKLPQYPGNWRLQFILFIVEQVLDILMSMAFMGIPVWLIDKVYIYKEENVTAGEAFMLSIPSLSAILAYGMQRYFSELYQRDAGKDLFDVYGAYNWISFFYYAFFIVTILVVIVLFQNLKGRQKDSQQTMLLKGHIQDMKRHISEVERLYRDIRSLKHDMGNHIMTLQGLYAGEKHEEAREYAARLKEEFQAAQLEIKSGNPVTDVILTEKYKEAKEKGIRFSCDFRYPEGTRINAFDVSIILNNAIINAIEAAEKCESPYIRIVSRRQRNAYLIIIENSCMPVLPRNTASGNLPATTKDSEEHGYGLSNIKKVAQSYYGDIDIKYERGSFELDVMLMCI